MNYVVAQDFNVTAGGKKTVFESGATVTDKGLPDRTIACMVKTGWLVPETDVVQEPSPKSVEEAPPAGGGVAEQIAAVDVSELELEDAVKKLLQENGLATVGDVLRFGSENDEGLQAINGIGEGKAQAIAEAIQSHGQAAATA